MTGVASMRCNAPLLTRKDIKERVARTRQSSSRGMFSRTVTSNLVGIVDAFVCVVVCGFVLKKIKSGCLSSFRDGRWMRRKTTR